MQKKRVFLITGASGFIGSVLLRRLLSENQTVHLILRKNSNTWRINDLLKKVKLHYSDLSSVEELLGIVKKVKPNVIYHLATHGAYSYQKDSNKIINTNILGTWNLLQACNSVKYELFVNTGSSSEYGPKSFAMRETDLLEPNSYYAVSKCSQTLLCEHISKSEGRPIVTLRPFSVYGPYEEPKRFIPNLLTSFLFGEKLNLVSPSTARDLIYIDDVVDAYLKINELIKNSGSSFNIGTGVQSSIKKVFDLATEVTGKKIKPHWGQMESRIWDTTNWVADISKARRLLNWTPKVSLKNGLEKTWAWFQNNSNFYHNES